MHFKKVNNIAGWLVFAIAFATYWCTLEATVSLWDCGEFLSAAYKLQVGHSPGAPLFMMLARIFGMLSPDKSHIAFMINSMSALMSALTILFLFFTITHFARKLVMKEQETVTKAGLVTVIGAGVVGALAFTFSDTFWFSAVEAEVYATSSFFTAVVFWAALKWDAAAEEPYSDRWLILIFYLTGLSIGVHLLNLLTVPAIVMVYYFKRYTFSRPGVIIAFIAGCVLLGFIQVGIIQYLPIIAAGFELVFVNSFGLPFNSGAIFFLLLLAGFMVWLVRYTRKKGRYLLHLATLCAAFIIIGYSSYICVLVRAAASVPINMGNPGNVMSLIPYLQRDQYGEMPLLSGPDFDSRVTEVSDGRAIYVPVKKDGRPYYELVDHKKVYGYDHTRLFPRVHDFNEAYHVSFYRSYLGLGQDESPSGLDNLKFFSQYQVGWMFWRYIMWNYAGRQNDIAGQGEAHNGNWISGIKPVDEAMGKGDIDTMPEALRRSRARNQYYFLPLLLGIAGLWYQFRKDKKDGLIVALLFFFTGVAIVIYLNNTPVQPRERDYTYVGATYAYAIWIGLGVLAVTGWLRRIRMGRRAAPAAVLLCMTVVPLLMAFEGWDDHDRSHKTIARDYALNTLNTCDSNAILITYGDNDTYPLWYLQEVEGIRTDVRIINYNLLGTDWQNDQLFAAVNKAAALPVIWKPEHYRGEKLNYLPYHQDPRLPADRYFELAEVIGFFTSGRNMLAGNLHVSYLPAKNFLITLNRDEVVKSGLVAESDTALIPDAMRFVYNGSGAAKPSLALMNIIAGQAKTGWTRPIYITEGTPTLGLDAYLQKEGGLLKLVPINKKSAVEGLPVYTALEKNINFFTKGFKMGEAKSDRVYYDEKNRNVLMTYRQNAIELAYVLVAEHRKADAIKVLDAYNAMISESSLPFLVLPYDQSALFMADAYYRAGALRKANALAEKIVKNISDEIRYFRTLEGRAAEGADFRIAQQNMTALGYLIRSARECGDTATAKRWEQMQLSLQL